MHLAPGLAARACGCARTGYDKAQPEAQRKELPQSALAREIRGYPPPEAGSNLFLSGNEGRNSGG